MIVEDPELDNILSFSFLDEPQPIQQSTSKRRRSLKPNRFTDPEDDQDPFNYLDPYDGNDKVPNWTWDRNSSQLPTVSHFYELLWEGTWWPCKYAKALSSGGHKIDFCDGTLDLDMALTPEVFRPLTDLGPIAVGGVFQYYYCSGRNESLYGWYEMTIVKDRGGGYYDIRYTIDSKTQREVQFNKLFWRPSSQINVQ